MTKEAIQFIREKDYRYIREIGQGATGRTILLSDDEINEDFVCKKYSPHHDPEDDSYFHNFINEIKVLFKLHHKNVVRIFNYYLYPSKSTGYILMEYIEGTKISDYIKSNPDKINDVFTQVIDGFSYLEQNKILHRDVRPENILVNNSGIVKIIDFGFCKQIPKDTTIKKSISLNWRYDIPEEFNNSLYTSATDLYFIGKLFEEIISRNKILDFRHTEVLSKMTNKDPNKRFASFTEIEIQHLESTIESLDFTDSEKRTYRLFADQITEIVDKLGYSTKYISDTSEVIRLLETVQQNSILEFEIQDPGAIISCFIEGNFKYYKNRSITVRDLKEFIKFFKSSTPGSQKIILNNLWLRFGNLDRETEITIDDLPF